MSFVQVAAKSTSNPLWRTGYNAIYVKLGGTKLALVMKVVISLVTIARNNRHLTPIGSSTYLV